MSYRIKKLNKDILSDVGYDLVLENDNGDTITVQKFIIKEDKEDLIRKRLKPRLDAIELKLTNEIIVR